MFEVLDTFTTCGQRQQSPPASSLSTETTRDCQAPPSLSRLKREVGPTSTLYTHYNLRRFGHSRQLPPCGVAESSVNFAGDKSGNVTSAWWQVTLCYYFSWSIDSSQWCIAKNEGGYTQTGVAKGLKVPCLFMIAEVSIRCQKNPEVGIRRIPAYTPQYTTDSSVL